MNRFIIPALLLLGAFMGKAEAQPVTHIISAQPYAWPAQLGGSGSPYKTGYTNTGRWIAWTYVKNKQERIWVGCLLYNHSMFDVERTDLRAPGPQLRAFIDRNVDRNCSVAPEMRPMYLAAREAFGLK